MGATIIASRRRYPGHAKPIPSSDGGLRVREASAGSLDLLFEPIGQVAVVLLSDPVQLTLTLYALLGIPVRIRAWIARRSSASRSLAGVDNTRKSLDALDSEQPQVSEVSLPDGTHARGMRVTIVRQRRDGDVDVIIAESVPRQRQQRRKRRSGAPKRP